MENNVGGGKEQVPVQELGEMQPNFERVSPKTKAALGAVAVEATGDKVWLERASEVVKETEGDPNKRLTEVALLREEYMRKRHNRILGGHNE